MSWSVVFAKHAQKDAQIQNPPPDEKLVGDLSGAYSRRINIQHRLVYQALKEERMVKVLRCGCTMNEVEVKIDWSKKHSRPRAH